MAQTRRPEKEKKSAIKKAGINFPNIPEEIIIEILSRLPLTSAGRFMCVSKQWNSYMKMVFQKNRRQKVLLLSYKRNNSYFLHSMNEDYSLESVDIPWKKRTCNSVAIMGSCNGLLLLRTEEDLFLWNPVTRFFKKVMGPYFRLGDKRCNIISGLCYDSLADEYKAVVALPCKHRSHGGEFVIVGSFRSKRWEEVSFPYNVRTVNSGPVLSENLHWYVSRTNLDRFFLSPQSIVSFNPRTNKFNKVPMPQPKHMRGDNIIGLGVLDGCLCMVRRNYTADVGNNVEVWTMKKYGVKESWNTMLVLSNVEIGTSDKLVPMCPIQSAEGLTENLLWVTDGSEGKILACNSNENSHRKIPIPIKQRFLTPVAYEESLVTPMGYDWEEEEIEGEPTYGEIFTGVISSLLTVAFFLVQLKF